MNFISMLSGFAILVVSLMTSSVFGEEPVLPFHYSNDWSLVSAPPPAGPYRPVNIDPRVPGPGAVTELPMLPPQSGDKTAGTAGSDGVATTGGTEPSTQQSVNDSAVVEQDISARVPGIAPSAGIPMLTDETTSPADSAKALDTSPEPVVGETDISKPGAGSDASTQGVMPAMPVPAPGYGRRFPQQSPPYNYPPPGYPYQSMYRGNRNIPPPGYYNPEGRDEEPEVPPPPEFDGMYERRSYQGGSW